MPKARIIPGNVTADRLNALVLASTKWPLLEVVRRSDRQPVTYKLSPLQYSPDLATELDLKGIDLFKLVATGLSESTEYVVEDRTSGSLREVVLRTLPSRIGPEGLTIVVGSCYHEGFGKAAGYLAALKSSRFSPPAFKLLIGDNLYVDIGPTKPNRDTGYTETVDRYLTYFWGPLGDGEYPAKGGYPDVLSTLPTFTTWDDHEFWNNYPEYQMHLLRSYPSSKHYRPYIEAGKECLELFQKTLNPPSIGPNCGSYIFEVPPLSFFVADTRSNRTLHKTSPRQMFSTEELQAFENWAASREKAPGVFVIGQPLWLEKGYKVDYNPPDFEQQYARIWKAIENSPCEIMVISGDVHHSRVLDIALRNRIVHEFVVSPACHIPTNFAIGLKTYGSQGQGEVKIAKSVEIDHAESGLIKPKLSRYLFGTDKPNTIAFLHFRLKAKNFINENAAFDIGGAFIDLDTQRVPKSTKTNLSLEQAFPDCDSKTSPLFTLR